MESSRGLRPHQRGLRVSTMRCAPWSILDTTNGPADGPGASSWPLLKTSGFVRHAAGLYPAGKHPLPFGVRLVERDHRLALVNAHGHRFHPIETGIAGDQEPLVVTAACFGL